jgi:hypothetical protein
VLFLWQFTDPLCTVPSPASCLVKPHFPLFGSSWLSLSSVRSSGQQRLAGLGHQVVAHAHGQHHRHAAARAHADQRGIVVEEVVVVAAVAVVIGRVVRWARCKYSVTQARSKYLSMWRGDITIKQLFPKLR